MAVELIYQGPHSYDDRLTFPTGIAEDDMILILYSKDGDYDPEFTGFTRLTRVLATVDTQSLGIMYKVADGTENGTQIFFGGDYLTNVYVFRGVDLTDPFGNVSGGYNPAATGEVDPPYVIEGESTTTTKPNSVVFLGLGADVIDSAPTYTFTALNPDFGDVVSNQIYYEIAWSFLNFVETPSYVSLDFSTNTEGVMFITFNINSTETYVPPTGEKRALIVDFSQGCLREIQDGELGTGRKPIVLLDGTLKEQVADEGVYIVVDEGNLRQIDPSETLLI